MRWDVGMKSVVTDGLAQPPPQTQDPNLAPHVRWLLE